MNKDTDMTMQERLRWPTDYGAEFRKKAADHIDQLEADKAELVAWAVLATNEFNAVRARDGAPQHIDWYRGQPLQTDSCTHEWWDKMTEGGFALIAKHKAKP